MYEGYYITQRRRKVGRKVERKVGKRVGRRVGRRLGEEKSQIGHNMT